MTDAWTPDVVNRLNQYLDEMRRDLSSERGVNPDEVIEDVRAHVHTELRDAESPVTVNALEGILNSLGSPSEPRAPMSGLLADWGPPMLVFALFMAGIVLFGYAPYLVIVSAIAARAVLARDGRAAANGPKAWLILPPLVLLGIVLLGALLIAPFFPAGEILVRRAGGSLTPAVVASLGIVLGVWWMLLAWVIAAGRRGAAWLMQPFAVHPPRIARFLAAAGAIVATLAALVLVFVG